ncbi:hypothetical protein [Hymenobacter sp. HDW8]|uniref:hypothetical protein n=1 Tax=Hymenobacter sp. HDW8 TaxID=2714932 RepID=UPI00140BB799|nr:hypothetical protein [Hymenobacter sp. HDW8]QIL75482.1 hypothetical protein G7064_06155 [Hymenobacter sp. HDW8]
MNPAAPSNHTLLYDKRHALRQRAKGLSHLMPAFVLLTGILAVISGKEPLTTMVIIELVVGAAYIILLVQELRHLSRGHLHPGKVAWLEIAAGGVLALEGYHIMHRHQLAEAAGAPQRFHVLPWLYFAVAVVYVGLAFWLPRVLGRRHLHLHEAGFGGRLHPLRPGFSFAWEEVASVEAVGAADVRVHLTDGSEKQISFAKMHDGAAHRDRLLAHAKQKLRN